MSYQQNESDGATPLQCLADGRRRRLLAILLDRASPVAERELATHLAADEQGKPLVEVTREEVRTVRASLVHVHLPKLAEVDLVAWDDDESTVTTTDHPALGNPQFRRIVETDADWFDEVVACLRNERRRIALAVLDGQGEPMAKTDLARQVAARETTGVPSTETVEEVLRSLHHVHLPKLEDTGVVECDSDAETVVYEGHPSLLAEWFEFEPDETPRSVVADAERDGDVWTIEGRSNVLARGRSLVRQADEEVVLVCTTDGLLEAECFRVIEDAVDRGVDVYLGSQTPAVREEVRERVPRVTIWEPQFDWLNLPPDRERLGRLVFVDREAVMLGTLGERDGDGTHSETAITGEGVDDTLVVLLRELLGSRLDHLDARSADFRSQMPM